jgi:hypothetical protein
MAGFPEPEAGLVISYSCLWKEEEVRCAQSVALNVAKGFPLR